MQEFVNVMNQSPEEIDAMQNDKLNGYEVINHYLCSILKLWRRQVIILNNKLG
jgi:hypothetical protein